MDQSNQSRKHFENIVFDAGYSAGTPPYEDQSILHSLSCSFLPFFLPHNLTLHPNTLKGPFIFVCV